MEKKLVTVKLETFTSDFFQDNLDQLITKLTLLKSNNLEFTNHQIDTSYVCDYTEFVLKGDRLETDGEYNKRMIEIQFRLKSQLKRKFTLEERERRQLEKLKAKYEL